MDQEPIENLKAQALQFLKQQPGVQTPAGTVIRLNPAEADIASLLGMSRADATRALNALKVEGVIEIEGSTFILRR